MWLGLDHRFSHKRSVLAAPRGDAEHLFSHHPAGEPLRRVRRAPQHPSQAFIWSRGAGDILRKVNRTHNRSSSNKSQALHWRKPRCRAAIQARWIPGTRAAAASMPFTITVSRFHEPGDKTPNHTKIVITHLFLGAPMDHLCKRLVANKRRAGTVEAVVASAAKQNSSEATISAIAGRHHFCRWWKSCARNGGAGAKPRQTCAGCRPGKFRRSANTMAKEY